jgi:hypothetical protein
VATVDDRLMGIRREWLSSHWPTELTAVASLPLPPSYETQLTLSPHQMLNYWKPVHGIQTMLSIPTRLESTSILFAYGHDIYITIVTPSDTFDRLKDSFSKSLLLITLISLFLATIATAKWVRRKQFYAYWQSWNHI